ncbi:DUF3379 family protein [Lentisalinibacter sediminis]|uniref:DUF3379 family protein n=1 Tax=Lentisalinibacter sediminis TaxID=2992237 RepID=UPI0038671C9A
MRCEEFRERLDGDPGADFPGRSAHAAGCADCARYAAEAAVFERRLAAALAVDVPDFPVDLPEDDHEGDVGGRGDKVVSLDGRRHGRGARWRGLPAWVGVAAALALAVTLTLQFGSGPQELDSSALAAEVIAHMDHEPYSRVVTDEAVAGNELRRVLTPAVSRLDAGRVGLVTYAKTCPINGRDVPHLVVQGADGPVTLLLMAGEKLDAPVPLEGDGFHGVILPVGEGSIAVVGQKGQSVDDVTENIRNAVDWQI